jgi:predicted O-linked N-acetylglucosamine transferase (SPINDLY family)
LWTGALWRHDKIRIAYLASGFHGHPTGYLSAELIENHDRSRFEVLAISTGPDDGSDIRTRLVRAFDQFHDVRDKNDREVAALIHDLQVDIVIDRSGYTANARSDILACRPAPIQASYIGFPGTLGAEFYDYVIADRIVLPFDQQAFYTEKIVHLPDSYLVTNSTLAIAESIPARREAGLPERGSVFCCFNNDYKITPPIFDIWMRLLRRIDGSVLWLYRSNPAAEKNLRKEAAARGVDPARLVFADRLKLDQHLARHRLADLCLDTLPYNAHTTASDALWAGLPLVTCRGRAFAGRVAASLLHAIGVSELVTENLEDYEGLALRLATEPALLGKFRERLQQNRLAYPLFDNARYARHIEAAYTRMWETWQRGERPQSFAVEPLVGRDAAGAVTAAPLAASG